MNYMFENGFLGTRAPYFMDMVTLIVALLPLLLALNIVLVKKGFKKTHIVFNIIIYIVTVVVFSYFEYGVRLAGGFDSFSQGSDVGHNYMLIVLVLHIIISTITIVVWTYTMFAAKNNIKNDPNRHKRFGTRSFNLISMTSFSGIWVYMLLFIY